ncbi:immunity 26/phosphotriesterase HocA family protein [Salmonella bongori]|uniref:immunity 26/phosphotriesterase HocA family protein n=1 Tax=Salmonella bongori TaxID=54736 RepID=UPI0020A67FF7|nr:immunity 26/phosphotriesterase HocA family protein [Salmonella bongori]
MSDFKFWGWDKKPRTMLRFVKPGDIFCFKLEEDRYCFGRIITLMTVGHLSELFDVIKRHPEITGLEISNAKRIIEPIIVDTYSLFDKKLENGSDWRIIGHQENYEPVNLDGIYFAFGIGDSCKKKDCYGNVFSIPEDEWKTLPKLSPKGDFDIKKRLELA